MRLTSRVVFFILFLVPIALHSGDKKLQEKIFEGEISDSQCGFNVHSTSRSHDPGEYEIRVKGHLDPRWAAWFDGMSLTTESDGTTVLSGPVVDQSALFGALSSVSLGKPLYWIAMAIGIAIASRTLVTRERFVLIALLVQFLCYLSAYLATPFDVMWHVTWSWERLVAHLTPALTYVVLISLVTAVRPKAPTYPTRS